MTDKPSQNEEEYFAKQDAELIKKQRSAEAKAADEAERKTHFMRCPKCGGHLATREHQGIQIDQCPDCEGIFLDKGELEQLVGPTDPGLLGRFFGGLFDYKKT